MQRKWRPSRPSPQPSLFDQPLGDLEEPRLHNLGYLIGQAEVQKRRSR